MLDTGALVDAANVIRAPIVATAQRGRGRGHVPFQRREGGGATVCIGGF